VIAIGNTNGQIIVYKTQTGNLVRTSEHLNGAILDLAFVPNTDFILSLTESDLMLWNWITDQGIYT